MDIAKIPFGYSATWAEKDKYNVKTPTESRPQIRLALIGLGGIAIAKHLPAIRRLRDTGVNVAVVAGADPDAGLRDKVQALHNFPCYADAREMLDGNQVDAALALTDPGESRLRVMTDVIDRGIHLFAEKPLLFLGVDRLDESLERARELLDRAAARKLVVATGLVKQFSPPYQVAKALVDEGQLGRLSMIALKMCQGWSRHILLEGQACHILHVCRWIAGEVKGLNALGINRYAEPNYPYDNIVVNVEFESGAIGTFYFNSSSPSLKPWERLEIFGDRKWLSVEDATTVTLHEGDEGPSKTWFPVMPHTLMFDEEFSGFTGELRDFIGAARGEHAPAVSGEDGIAVLLLAHMIHTSIRQRRFVTRAECAPRTKELAA